MIYRARGLVQRYPGSEPLRFPDFRVAAGDRVGLVGGNGSGKTTLVELLVGLAPAAEGSLEFDGRDLEPPLPPEVRRRIGYVAQQPFALPGIAEANVALAVPADQPRAERRKQARAWLERLGIAALAGKQERTLSVGQLRRVAVARAFARRAEVLVLDEPFAFGDARYRETLARLLDEHHGSGGTLIVTSPQPEELKAWATATVELGEQAVEKVLRRRGERISAEIKARSPR